MDVINCVIILILMYTTLRYKKRSERDLFTDVYHKQWFLGQDRRSKRLIKLMKKAKKRVKYSFGILFIDLDHFKKINDTEGHVAGDNILCEVVEILKKSTRQSIFSRIEVCKYSCTNRICKIKQFVKSVKLIIKSVYLEIRTSEFKPCDWIVRFGGDEFFIVVRGIQSEKDLNKVANRILNKLRDTNKITASIGGTFFKVGKDDINEEVIIKKVDDATYKSKDKGRNCYTIFD